MPKRRVVTVRCLSLVSRVRYSNPWVVVERSTKAVLDSVRTREEAIRVARYACLSSWHDDGIPAQMIVYTRKGTISFERTYPRSSDPKRRKG